MLRICRNWHSIAIGGLVVWLAAVAGAGDGEPSSAEFLAAARRPFLQDAWARFTGDVQCKKDGRTIKVPLQLAVLMHRDYLRAQFVIDGQDVYNVIQAYADEGVSNVQVELPATPGRVTLEDLGVNAADITFSFLYWDLLGEMPRQRVRGQDCRVLRMRNPQTLDQALVFCSAKYVGPLRIEHYRGDSQELLRWLEFTDFERTDKLYYVKAARLGGGDSDTRVKFGTAELAESSQRRPPEDLFVRRPQDPDIR